MIATSTQGIKVGPDATISHEQVRKWMWNVDHADSLAVAKISANILSHFGANKVDGKWQFEPKSIADQLMKGGNGNH